MWSVILKNIKILTDVGSILMCHSQKESKQQCPAISRSPGVLQEILAQIKEIRMNHKLQKKMCMLVGILVVINDYANGRYGHRENLVMVYANSVLLSQLFCNLGAILKLNICLQKEDRIRDWRGRRW